MQINLEKAVSYLKSNLFLVLPLILWLSLWLSIQSTAIENILHPESPVQFLHGLRGTLPYLAAVLAVLLVAPLPLARVNRNSYEAPKEPFTVAVVGKYADLPDAYISVKEALRHAGG